MHETLRAPFASVALRAERDRSGGVHTLDRSRVFIEGEC